MYVNRDQDGGQTLKALIASLILMAICSTAYAEMGYVQSYYRRDGTLVSGHWKDVSGDGYSYNNRKAVWGY